MVLSFLLLIKVGTAMHVFPGTAKSFRNLFLLLHSLVLLVL